MTDPPLTTVRQDIEGMGRLMVRLLMRSIDQDGGGPGAAETAPRLGDHADGAGAPGVGVTPRAAAPPATARSRRAPEPRAPLSRLAAEP